MATITTGHDTQGTTAAVKRAPKKQTPMWVFLLAAPLALVVAAGGMRVITDLQDMGAASYHFVK